MRIKGIIILFIVLLSCSKNLETGHPFHWDKIDSQSKPWARWWWLGSSVNESEISRQLKELKKAGFGGVEIQPIYPEKESPIKPITYLSERWAEVFLFTLQEAQQLGLGVDLTLGSGWPFGGPWLEPQNAARKLEVTRTVYSESDTERKIVDDSKEPIESVILVPQDKPSVKGEIVDYKKDKGQKYWTIPQGRWRVYVVKIGYTGQQVKRATVGSEGAVLDHFSHSAFDNYVQPFNKLNDYIGQMRPRCNFNDSYEVYNANWTPKLFTAFYSLHGYDLRNYIPILIDNTDSKIRRKILHDYRETVYSLYVEQFCIPWTEWSHKNRMQIRFQAHGAPGNLIDLYGISDIPETEGFGREEIDILFGKFASSGAHLYGRKLCSSETFTWLDEHFQVSLDRMKKSVDKFFLAGINHIFYHGVPFSQPGDGFPGAVFYASTHAGETNTWWPHVHYLNEYIGRIQSALQANRFDPDVMLYFPMHDVWHDNPRAADLLQFLGVNFTKGSFQRAAGLTWETAKMLQERGWQFDYVSDKVIAEMLATNKRDILCSDMHYKALIFAGTQFTEEKTIEKIKQLLDEGVYVIFIGNIPSVVERGAPNGISKEYKSEILKEYSEKYKELILINSVDELPELLNRLKIENEKFTDEGLKFIRLRDSDSELYYMKNFSDKNIDKWISLNCDGNAVITGNPLTNEIYRAEMRKNEKGIEIHLKMEPQSTLLLLAAENNRYDYIQSKQSMVSISEIPLKGPWEISWVDYDGEKHSKSISQLVSWTDWKETEFYSGEMEYQTTFKIADDDIGKRFTLNPGELHESAEIFINGDFAGAVWTTPYTLDITDKSRHGENIIQIKVRNLMANRIIELDRRGVNWRKYFFVNIDYKPFDASGWEPLPSGLIGPVMVVLSENE